MCQTVVFSLVIIYTTTLVVANDYYLSLEDNGPVVQGAEITFTARLFENKKIAPKDNRKYIWNDNAIPPHKQEVMSQSSEMNWTISYPADKYPPGPYIMQVEVQSNCFLIFCTFTSQRILFEITGKLNGKMLLKQNNTIRTNEFISNTTEVVHDIGLKLQDYEYLTKNATSVMTYWFVDCTYYGATSNLTFSRKYGKTNEDHVVEALVVAGFEPITTPAPSTTSTTPATTTKTTTSTTTKRTTSTTSPKIEISKSTPKLELANNINKSGDSNNKVKREIQSKNTIFLSDDVTFPDVCLNQTNIAVDPKKVYGYFSTNFTVRAPVMNITVDGNVWIVRDDVLDLKVKCLGSPPFTYCVNYYMGVHNISNNETCNGSPTISDSCLFQINRFYRKAGENSIVVILQNDVSKEVNKFTINIYEVTTQPQLSVIVVPVVFILVAVVLIVFGLAYYIQNRTRFIVEVADFDFGQKYTDMEYKTFRERLRDSITSALTRTPTSDQGEPSSWPSSSGRKYGSMT